MIKKWFKPKSYINNVSEIDVNALSQAGFRYVICDVDNTLVQCDQNVFVPEAITFLKDCKEANLHVILCSNNLKSRIKPLAIEAELSYYSFFCKPIKWNYRRVAKHIQCKKSEMVCIGDQLCTDILGGNRFGIHSIFIEPLTPRDFVQTKVSRLLEDWVLNYLHDKKEFKRGDYYGYKKM